MGAVLKESADLDFINGIVLDVIKEFPLKIEEYQNGKTGIVNMLMSEIKSRTKDKFEPRTANELLMNKLPKVIAVDTKINK